MFRPARRPCPPADPQHLLSLAHPPPFHGHKGGLWDSNGAHLSEVPENEVLTTPLASGSSTETEEISDYSQYNDADEVRPCDIAVLGFTCLHAGCRMQHCERNVSA